MIRILTAVFLLFFGLGLIYGVRAEAPIRSMDRAQIETIGYDEVLQIWLSSALGIPYHWGGNNAVEGFDCSGFIMEYLKMFGIAPPRDSSSDMIYDYFMQNSEERISHYFPAKGSLIFYGKKTQDGRRIAQISHIGLMINPNQVAEAGGGTRSTLSPREAAAQNAFVRIRPYKYRKDIVFILNPKMPDWVGFEDEIRENLTENCKGSICDEPHYGNYLIPYVY